MVVVRLVANILNVYNKLQGSALSLSWTCSQRVPREVLIWSVAIARFMTILKASLTIQMSIRGCNPGFAHKEPIMAAIKAGKPVFSENLWPTAADCKRNVDAEMAGVKLVQVGFMRRYDKGYRQVKELLDGTFGKPLLAKCTHRAISVDPSYTTDMLLQTQLFMRLIVLHWLLMMIGHKSSNHGADTKHAHEGLKDPRS